VGNEEGSSLIGRTTPDVLANGFTYRIVSAQGETFALSLGSTLRARFAVSLDWCDVDATARLPLQPGIVSVELEGANVQVAFTSMPGSGVSEDGRCLSMHAFSR
jgi:hypothetical protein